MKRIKAIGFAALLPLLAGAACLMIFADFNSELQGTFPATMPQAERKQILALIPKEASRTGYELLTRGYVRLGLEQIRSAHSLKRLDVAYENTNDYKLISVITYSSALGSPVGYLVTNIHGKWQLTTNR